MVTLLEGTFPGLTYSPHVALRLSSDPCMEWDRRGAGNVYIIFFSKDFIYLFMRHTERGRDTDRGRSRLHAGSLTRDSIPGLQDHALSQSRRSTTEPPRHPAQLDLENKRMNQTWKLTFFDRGRVTLSFCVRTFLFKRALHGLCDASRFQES